MIYIVATPIGNLNDISMRAIKVLKNVNLILAEDTRHSKKLLDFYHIKNTVQALHDHNEKHIAQHFIGQLINKQIQSIAVISDAGTPLINDPGFMLVRLAKQHNIPVSPIPGSSSVIAALSVSGLPSDAFCFLGFAPTKTSQKVSFLNSIHISGTTNIFFESPKRVLVLLQLMHKTFDKHRQICLAKELTKTFETIITGSTVEIIDYLTRDNNHQNGEFVILVEPNKNTNKKHQLLAKILPILSKELPKTQAAKIAAKITGLTKKDCYQVD